MLSSMGGGERLAVRAERHLPHQTLMTLQRIAQGFASRDIPQNHRPVFAC